MGILLAARANIWAKNSQGMLPIHWAAANGRKESVDVLIFIT